MQNKKTIWVFSKLENGLETIITFENNSDAQEFLKTHKDWNLTTKEEIFEENFSLSSEQSLKIARIFWTKFVEITTERLKEISLKVRIEIYNQFEKLRNFVNWGDLEAIENFIVNIEINEYFTQECKNKLIEIFQNIKNQ
jgi:hypothetical protein